MIMSEFISIQETTKKEDRHFFNKKLDPKNNYFGNGIPLLANPGESFMVLNVNPWL